MHSVPHADRVGRSDGVLAVPAAAHAPTTARATTSGARSTCPAAGRCRIDDCTVRPPALHERPDAVAGPRRRTSRTTTRPGSTSATFDVPEAWTRRRVVLHVGAAEACSWSQVNGEFVGFSKDSHLAAEFDVTTLRAPAARTPLRLRVVKWSDASFIEDQDQWWHGGITRSVFLYGTRRDAPRRRPARRGLADDLTTGTLRATVDVALPRRRRSPEVGRSTLTELDELGVTCRPAARRRPLSADDGRRWRESQRGPRVRPTPSTVLARGSRIVRAERTRRLASDVANVGRGRTRRRASTTSRSRCGTPDGASSSARAYRIGFRRVEVAGTELLVNGQPVLHPRRQPARLQPTDTGRVLSPEQMRADLHADASGSASTPCARPTIPTTPPSSTCATSSGCTSIDEADIESHAFHRTMCDDPRYLSAFVDRVSRMVAPRQEPSRA